MLNLGNTLAGKIRVYSNGWNSHFDATSVNYSMYERNSPSFQSCRSRITQLVHTEVKDFAKTLQ